MGAGALGGDAGAGCAHLSRPLAGLLNGAIVVEQVFAVPGLGRLMLDGVLQRNFPVVQAAVMASASFYILTALIVDILYVYADPRIRH